jgi:NADPH-dependent 2,4-dienoyl-CoA reductase/sulfur reductase-like enzyme
VTTTDLQRVLVAGAATAGLSAARELRKQGFAGVIQLVDEEPASPYRRPEVSKGILSGKIDETTIKVRWPDDLDLELLGDVRLTEVDFAGRFASGHQAGKSIKLPYDGLVIATGSRARPSPFDPTLRNVFSLRSLGDGLRMRDAMHHADRIVLVGGGFIGLEVAAVARTQGKAVTVVEATDVPLGHALGDVFGRHMADLHIRRGVEIICGETVTGIEGSDGLAHTVSLSDGRQLPTDLVLVSIGSIPAVDWLTVSGLEALGGVLCDKTCAVVGLDDVVAAGDVANWFNPLYQRQMRIEHWTNAIEQGTYAGRRLLGVHDPEGFSSAPYFWSDQYGMRLQSYGSTQGYDEVEVLVHEDEKLMVAYGREGTVICAVGLQSGASILAYRRLVIARATMDETRQHAAEALAAPARG